METIPIAKTSNEAVGEQVDKSKGEDLAGPLNIAVAVEHKGWYAPSKIAVIGSSIFVEDYLSSSLGPYFNNGLIFFLDIVGWMYEAKDDVIISPKIYTRQYLDITAAQAQYMGIAVVVVLPLIILGAGVFVYIRRRHL